MQILVMDFAAFQNFLKCNSDFNLTTRPLCGRLFDCRDARNGKLFHQPTVFAVFTEGQFTPRQLYCLYKLVMFSRIQTGSVKTLDAVQNYCTAWRSHFQVTTPALTNWFRVDASRVQYFSWRWCNGVIRERNAVFWSFLFGRQRTKLSSCRFCGAERGIFGLCCFYRRCLVSFWGVYWTICYYNSKSVKNHKDDKQFVHFVTGIWNNCQIWLSDLSQYLFKSVQWVVCDLRKYCK